MVASYDTHKGKRWLNFDPPNHRAHAEVFGKAHVHELLIPYSHIEWKLLSLLFDIIEKFWKLAVLLN